MEPQTSSPSFQQNPPPWLSVSGQLLALDADPAFLGRYTAIETYDRLNQLGEGTYGIVHRARERTSSRIFALKEIRLSAEESQNGIPITALREIAILRSLSHANVIDLLDVVVGKGGFDAIWLVMEYAEQVDACAPRDARRVRGKASERERVWEQKAHLAWLTVPLPV